MISSRVNPISVIGSYDCSEMLNPPLTAVTTMEFRLKIEKNKTFWDCYLVRRGECKARAITIGTTTGSISVLKVLNSFIENF